jgi:hypothetical protein
MDQKQIINEWQLVPLTKESKGMAFIVKEDSSKRGGKFTPHPAGVQAAVLIDIHDAGMVENKAWGKTEPKVDFYWYAGETKTLDDGRVFPLLVKKQYTVSLADKAWLRKDLESWLARKLTDEEIKKGFDIEQLLGTACLLNVVHNEKGENVYANVNGVMPIIKGMETPTPPKDYIRMKDRAPKDEPAKQPAKTVQNIVEQEVEDQESELPF